MTMISHFHGTCRFCGDEFGLMLGKPDECGRCASIRTQIRNLSLSELALLIDAAAMVPEGTYQIVNTTLTEKVSGE